MNAADWTVYVVRCADATLYTGVARDLEARIAAHNAGRGAKYTRGRLPVQLVYAESAEGRGEALRREAEIKRLGAAAKRDLVGASKAPSAQQAQRGPTVQSTAPRQRSAVHITR